jgi:PPM family protein phosphatase
MTLSLRFAAVSDVGRSRKKNDDSGFAGTHFLMVADGMGGAPAGDLASSLAIQTMRRLDAPAPDDMLEALAGAVHRANDRLAEAIEEDSAVEGMGTTVDAVLFDGARIGVAHLGDSRGYLWRDGELLRLTSDHTWVQSLIDEGRITEDEAKIHAHRSLLLKVLDGRHDNDPDLTLYDVEAGDRILLCSDGLSSFVPHDRIERALSIGTADSAATELVTLALEGMSNDNITVVLADVVDEPAIETAPVVVGAAAEEAPSIRNRLRGWTHREEPEEAMLLPDDIDPEELRYAPREPKRYRWVTRSIIALVVVALLVGGGAWAYGWTQDQYYVSSDGEQVAIYQGIQSDLPGVDLHHVYATQDLTLDELPSYERSQVIEGLSAESLGDAHAIVGRLESFARACSEQTASSTSTSEETTKKTDKSSGKSGGDETTRDDRTPTKGDKSTGRTGGGSGPDDHTKGTKGSTKTKSTDSGDTGNEPTRSPSDCVGATPSTTDSASDSSSDTAADTSTSTKETSR